MRTGHAHSPGSVEELKTEPPVLMSLTVLDSCWHHAVSAQQVMIPGVSIRKAEGGKSTDIKITDAQK